MGSIETSYGDLLEQVAKNIKRIRRLRKLTQPGMAKLGFDVRNYQRLEAGDHSPSLYTLHKLARAFRCPMREFFR